MFSQVSGLSPDIESAAKRPDRGAEPPDTGSGVMGGVDLTVTEAAPLARRKPRTLRQLAEHGRIPGARKSGRVWLLPAEAVKALGAPRAAAYPPKESR